MNIWAAIIALWEKVEKIVTQFDDLTTQVQALTQAESDMESRVNNAIAALQEEINNLKAANPDISGQLAGIEAVVSRLQGFLPQN